MKNLAVYTSILLLLVILSGCYKEPMASFTMSASSVEVDEPVSFENTSVEMDRCEWLFGDGAQSTQASPSHTYTDPGTYEVVLRVFSKNDMKADIASTNITVIQPTILIVNVYDYDYEEALDDALVSIFDSENDFFEQSNPLAEATTGLSGQVIFEDVPGGKIYISVFREEYEEEGYYYFYSNWFISLNGNTFNTQVTTNKINEVDIYARLGYIPSSRIAGDRLASVAGR